MLCSFSLSCSVSGRAVSPVFSLTLIARGAYSVTHQGAACDTAACISARQKADRLTCYWLQRLRQITTQSKAAFTFAAWQRDVQRLLRRLIPLRFAYDFSQVLSQTCYVAVMKITVVLVSYYNNSWMVACRVRLLVFIKPATDSHRSSPAGTISSYFDDENGRSYRLTDDVTVRCRIM